MKFGLFFLLSSAAGFAQSTGWPPRRAAFECKDAQPNQPAFHTMQRDGDVEGDDFVSVALDTYVDRRTGYFFRVSGRRPPLYQPSRRLEAGIVVKQNFGALPQGNFVQRLWRRIAERGQQHAPAEDVEAGQRFLRC
jgi:hypothetical protein